MEQFKGLSVPGKVGPLGARTLAEARISACEGTTPHVCVDIDCSECLFSCLYESVFKEYLDGKQ